MRPIAATVPSITHGTRNVFADLGYPVARQGRLRLAFVLTQILERRRLTDAAAAKVLALSRREVAALRRHRLADFDMGRLMVLLVARGHDVNVVLSPKPRARLAARLTVRSAKGVSALC